MLLERVFLRVGSAETDEQLQNVLFKFLPPVLLKLASQTDGVRKKVTWEIAVNSMAPGGFEWNEVILKLMFVIDGWGISFEIALNGIDTGPHWW